MSGMHRNGDRVLHMYCTCTVLYTVPTETYTKYCTCTVKRFYGRRDVEFSRAAGRGHFGRGQWPPVFNFLAGRDQIFGRGQILSLLLVGLPLNKVLSYSPNRPLIKPLAGKFTL
jgi:hypothetical protein